MQLLQLYSCTVKDSHCQALVAASSSVQALCRVSANLLTCVRGILRR